MNTMANYFAAQYPLAAALEIPVIDAGPGFDELSLEAKLGPTRFAKLMHGVKEVFCCNHACYPETVPDSHRIQGYEVHCCYAEAVEAFLQAEG